MRAPKIVRPDAKGRVNLGALPAGISGFKLTTDKDGRFILEPLTEIPAREKWIFENPKLLSKVQKGLKDAVGRKLTKMEFSK
ncbi:MAG TPA: hypothetical protein VJK30_01255 [Coxiellaceae bacterium]|nr:MAG: hypothetical protein A3E81_04690 [Gammaproteobacteria bacterium RIFCSPHIGHO2_12_FULL_36_30]HLB55947.1 hypothetical protein [Coxiellaceae bacterium]